MEDCRWTGLADPRSLRRLLLIGCAAVPLLSQNAGAARTLPSGGHFVAGAGGIASSGTTTTVTQSSKRGIVDWKSFSIGKGDKVQFNNGSGATLNRVTGGSLSTIAGRLGATGSVYLINRNGVVVAPGGKVVTGGNFVASTRDVTNGQFMAGGAQTFTGASNGVVVNDGAVVSEGGSVVLIGHAATNSGSIDAAKGTATLASGNKVLMTDANGPERVYVAKGKSGDTTNDGQIRAAAVELAAAGGNVYALAGNRDGLIRATGTATVSGQVWLTSREGTVDVAGTVVAKDADGTGGTIMAKGAALKIENRTVLNAAGKTGKGRIATSAHDVSIGKARVTGGQKGKWTIDPTDLIVDSGAANTISTTLNAGTDVTERTTATTASGSGSTASGNGDITVASAINWNTTATLTLDAFHSININAAVTASGDGKVVLTTNNNIGGASIGGTLNFQMGQGSLQIAGAGGGLTIDGNPYTLVQTVADLEAVGSSGHYALSANLDATGVVGYVPIGESTPFTGTFNGLGNTVGNLTVVSAAQNAGVFGTVGAGGLVTNMGVTGGSVTSTSADPSATAGGLVGYNALGSITNSFATNDVSSLTAFYVGGLVGQSQGPIDQCYATGTVSGGSRTGGLLGFNRSTVSNSYATGMVTSAAGAFTGGLVGLNFVGSSSAVIVDSYSTGKVTAGGGFVGGLVGFNVGIVTDSYWDTDTSAVGTSAGGTGLTTAQLTAALPTGFSASVWANAGNKTTPYLGANPGLVYVGSDSTTLYNLVFTPTQLQAISNNLSANYALANNIDMTGIAFTPLGAFTGTLNGLGNVVANLTISSGASRVGFFATIGATGTVENFGLLGGSTFGGGSIVGALAGENDGTVTNVYATGGVHSSTAVGGLIGLNIGTITNAYATGAVSGGDNTGGLVALNLGTIKDSYATGTVSGGDANLGGLVGQNLTGSISEAYATGQVSSIFGGVTLGGLVGRLAGGTIDHSFWNIDRSGQSSGVGAGSAVGTTGLSGAQVFSAASYSGLTFTTTPGATGNAWVMVDKDGTLNGTNGATMPMLASEYTTGNIVNAHQLQLMAMDSAATYTLGGNIDASATSVASLAAGRDVWGRSGFGVNFSLTAFTGSFDGTGHTISGLTIVSSGLDNVGVFGQTSGATINNVRLAGGSVSAGVAAIAVGGLVGMSKNTSITFVSDSGSVSSLGSSDVGGLVGLTITGGTISNSSAGGAVTAAGAAAVGGLIGRSLSVGGALTMSNDSASGAVIGTNAVGGLVGDSHANIAGSGATGTVTGSTQVGGLVGVAGGTITNSTATGAVTGTGALAIAGGLTGQNSGIINGSSATGPVTATTGGSGIPSGGPTIGGLAGISTGAIGTSTASGAVTAGTDSNGVGGLIGRNTGTVNQSSSTSSVTAGIGGQNIGGLIGRSAGAVDQSFSTGAVVADASTAIGGLVGLNINGTITQSYSIGSVTGTGASTSVGGLVGSASHSGITRSFAGGLVTGATEVGGLVGVLDVSTITQSYEVGSVTASGSLAGGLVGRSTGGSAISEVFAVGAVGGTATSGVGGLVGQSLGGSTVFSGYWDKGTTGQATSAGGTGMTTAQLQAALPSGFTGGAWGIVADRSYPYLAFQFAGTPQVVTGTVYTDNGITNAGPGARVGANSGGAVLNSVYGTVNTFANGYYYYLAAPGTIAASGNVLVTASYGSGGTTKGAAFADGVTDTVSGLSVYAGTLHEVTASTTNTTLQANLAAAEAGDLAAIALVAGLTNLRIDASGAFAVNSDISYATGGVTLNIGGAITESGVATITANILTGSSVGGATLTNSNQVNVLGSFTNTGSASPGIQFTDALAFRTSGTLSSDSGGVQLSAGGNLVLGGNITVLGQQVVLTSTGAISQTGGAISSAGLSAGAASGITLNRGNLVNSLNSFTNSGSGALSFTNTGFLNVDGPISATGDVKLTAAGLNLFGNVTGDTVTLSSSRSIAHFGGIITANTLTGRSVGGAALTGTNQVGTLGSFTNTGSGDISFTDGVAVATAGTIRSAGNITLTTTGAGATLTLGGNLTATGNTVTLNTAAAISQTAGIITAGTLTGTAGAAATLDMNNKVGTFSLTDSGGGNISFTSTAALTLAGSFANNLTVTTKSGAAITVTGTIQASTNLTFNSAGTITETGAGSVQAGGAFTGSSVGGMTLNRSNAVGAFQNFTNTGSGNVSFKNIAVDAAYSGLTTPGSLTLTGPGMVLAGNLTVGAGKTVTLLSTGGISQVAGIVTAATLTGSSASNTMLGAANRIGTLTAFTAGGALTLVDAVALTTTGSVVAGNGGSDGDLSLTAASLNLKGNGKSWAVSTPGAMTLTTTTGAITLGAFVSATGTMTLNAAGRITESAGTGDVTAGTLTGSSVGGTNLASVNVATLAAFANTGSGNLSIADTTGALTVSGQVSTADGATLNLIYSGTLTLNAASGLSAGSTGTVALGKTSSGSISQAAGSVITAGTLKGQANGGVSLGGLNQVAVLGPFSNRTSGDFDFTDARSFSTAGTVGSFGSLTFTAGAGDSLTLGGALTAGGNVNLNMRGAITQSAGSVIAATTLTGSSVGGATLTGANLVDNLGPFADSGAGNATGLSFTNAQALLTIGTVSSTGQLALTTTTGKLTLAADVTAPGGGVSLNSAGGINQLAGIIDPGSLLINSVGSVSLTGANTVDTVAGHVTGAGATLTFNDTANGLTIGTVGGVSGLSTNNGDITLRTTASGDIAVNRAVDAGAGAVTIATPGDLSIGAGGSVSAGGGATLATLGNFTNAGGADAITVGAGSRWLVYSSDPTADTDGGLKAKFIQYAATYDLGTLTGTTPATTGNGFLYSLAPAALILTGVTKTYDGTTGLSGATYTASGAVVGDTLVFGGSAAGGFAGKNAGTGIDVTVSGLTVTAKRGGVTVYGYTLASVTDDPIGTIEKASLTVSLTGSVEKTYDGNTAATLGAGNYALTGLVTGDAVSVSNPTGGTYASQHAGTGIAVSVGGLTLGGADAGNYVLVGASATGNVGVIDPKLVTAGLTGTVTKVSDGTNAATLTPANYTLTGVLGGDSASLSNPATGTYGSVQPGNNIAVTVTGLSLLGADAGDYRLASTTVTADIGIVQQGAPTTPFIPVQPPQPPQAVGGDAAAAAATAHALVVPKPELAEMVQLSGCTGGDFIAVVPGEDGHIGAVVVEAEGNKTVLHAAYAGCSGSKPVITTPQEVNAFFGGALAARPPAPVNFELYFNSGSTTLAAQAEAVFGQAVAQIAGRKPVDVVVTGFTDNTGTQQANDLLSMARARTVTKLLVARGLPPGAIATFGRGARDPQVPMPEHAAEEKNRRVEITVR